MDDDRRIYLVETMSCLSIAVMVVLFLTAGGFLFLYSVQSIHIAMANDQTAIFEEMRQKALDTQNAKEAAGFLEYTVSYYPSGTKQERGSQLDRIVECCRRCAIQNIIARLRTVT